MNKAISAGIGVGIGLIALAVILFAPNDADISQAESPLGVELSDQVSIEAKDSKSYDVNISEGLDVGDAPP